MAPITQADWAMAYNHVQQEFVQGSTHAEIFTSLAQAFPNLQPRYQLQSQMRRWNMYYRRFGALTLRNGRPKPQSELPMAEVKRILNVDDFHYDTIRQYIRGVFAQLNIDTKANTNPTTWGQAMSRLKMDHPAVRAAWAGCLTPGDHQRLDNALNLLMRKQTRR